MPWRTQFHPAFTAEFDGLSEAVQDEMLALVELLKVAGPQLKRPRSDTLNGSKHDNMKELRFDAEDGVWRVAYAFDPEGDPCCWSQGINPALRNGASTKLWSKRPTPVRRACGGPETDRRKT